jgi:hypothetical protein
MLKRVLPILAVISLAACGAPAAAPTATQPPATSVPTVASAGSNADLSAIKTYLLDKAGELSTSSAKLSEISNRYYDVAKAANFDYQALWTKQGDVVSQTIQDARAEWIVASPLYEQMEGIVAGVPALAQYDVILDSGTSAQEGGDNVVPFDLKLPDGRTLSKPGNLFGVTESTLWGTFPDYMAKDVQPDFNHNGKSDFGERLPDANVLKAGAEALSTYSAQLLNDAKQWTPSVPDAFTALVVMVPTMSEYFESWKHSRYIAGDASTQRDFVAVSRLNDIQDILSSLQVVHEGVSPLIQATDQAQDEALAQGLTNLKQFVRGVDDQEKNGKHFSPEEADTLGAEAQSRATAITGQISQMAAKLNIKIEQ